MRNRQRQRIRRLVARFVVPALAAAAVLAPSAQAYIVVDEGERPVHTYRGEPTGVPYSPARAPAAEPSIDVRLVGAVGGFVLTLAFAGTAFVVRTRSRLGVA